MAAQVHKIIEKQVGRGVMTRYFLILNTAAEGKVTISSFNDETMKFEDTDYKGRLVKRNFQDNYTFAYKDEAESFAAALDLGHALVKDRESRDELQRRVACRHGFAYKAISGGQEPRCD